MSHSLLNEVYALLNKLNSLFTGEGRVTSLAVHIEHGSYHFYVHEFVVDDKDKWWTIVWLCRITLESVRLYFVIYQNSLDFIYVLNFTHGLQTF